MQTTSNYGLKVYEGGDLFNPLTVENVNTEALDLIIKAISDQAIGTATELTTGTVHALTRSDSDQALFRFTATSNFASGDTFTVDTIQVSALTINGQALPDNAYLAGAEVLCALVGTRLTVYGVTGSTVADDSLKLGGQLPSYYGTAAAVLLAQNTADAAGDLASQLNTRVTYLETEHYVEVVADGTKTYAQLLTELNSLVDNTKLTVKSVVKLNDVIYHNTNLATREFDMISASTGSASITAIALITPKYLRYYMATSGTTFANYLNDTAQQGDVIRVIY